MGKLDRLPYHFCATDILKTAALRLKEDRPPTAVRPPLRG